MMITTTLTRQLRPVLPSVLRLASRNEHFLAGVPLKKRGVDSVSADDLQGKKFYEQLGDADRKNLEIIWISRDKEAQDQLDYYEKAMPAWSYIPFGDPNIK
ncbi:unnamed protein product [Nippostrongylus brasiliensis]|uniref:Nucleoredoxin-like protein 2 (inferred by orthology to a human protein) n=1 Tax=Nippostrongylus brasiliensis TaxID=27835 RepID=A0A158R391_NIPBR|nr:unnamed protein product [Nippostrongylus brasiliensis]